MPNKVANNLTITFNLKALIDARCTDTILWSITSFIGILLTFLHSIPLITNSWVYVIEPRPINKTNENGDFLVLFFKSYLIIRNAEIERRCHWNPIFTGEDLTEYSSATLAIENRLAVPATMHIIGAILCYLAFFFGTIGHLKRNSQSLISAIIYICGGLIILMGVLQFVCVVDDEMAPRMKPNAAGEPSKFKFQYGDVSDKIKVIPGLAAHVRHTQMEKALLGVQMPEAMKRESEYAIFNSFSHRIPPTTAFGSISPNSSPLPFDNSLISSPPPDVSLIKYHSSFPYKHMKANA
ncbi:unnamed protein product [Dracunculus medinensis]|uniref:Uncharacterized protein n=1 Tax=Dracunculus medinensis TaxID=318479 RepID=A0A3P7SQJ9_DRAME|nr:unnamed protein product [Dracunculus medinensis]